MAPGTPAPGSAGITPGVSRSKAQSSKQSKSGSHRAQRLKENRIYLRDAVQGLRQFPENSVDLIVTDPPYNIASKSRRTIVKSKIITTAEAFGLWDVMHPFDHEVLILQVISEAYRVLKQGGSFYLFMGRHDNGYYVRKALERGFTYRTQIVIVKTPATLSLYKNAWRSGFDMCMYLTKGRVGVFHFPGHAEAVNVYRHSICHKQSDHPTEKPLELIKRFVSVSSNPGDLVVDPFMGSGTTAVACKALGRKFIGFELNQTYVKMAKKRLSNTLGVSAFEPRRRCVR